MPKPNIHHSGQLAMGIGALAVAAVLAFGALAIPSDAGYAGVGPDFLPWVVSAAGSVQQCHYPAFLSVGKAVVSERVRWLHERPPLCFRHF